MPDAELRSDVFWPELENSHGQELVSAFSPQVVRLNNEAPSEVFWPNLEGFEGDDEELNCYAWGRLGRKLIEEEALSVFNQTPLDTPFIYLDGCSSTPYLREVMRGQFGREIGLAQTRKAVNQFVDEIRHRAPTLPHELVRLRQEKQNWVRSLFEKDNPARQIIDAILFDVVFDPDSLGLDVHDVKALSSHFLHKFNTGPSKYLKVIEEHGSVKEKGSWRSLRIEDTQDSLAGIASGGQLSESELEALLQATSDHFAISLAGNIKRSSRFYSLDLKGARDFSRNPLRDFPEDVINTVFFSNALDEKRHIVGDIRSLPFADGTVSVYSMVEGFPFHTRSFGETEGMHVVSEAARVIRPGGKFIVFPWLHREGVNLEVFEQVLRREGFKVEASERKKHGEGGLLDGMNARELVLVSRSPVFTETTDRDSLPILVATKIAA